jgi:hypothetical protein
MAEVLELTYRQDETDGEGYLRARYNSPTLSGEFDWFVGYLGQHVLVPFERQLAAYPISEADSPLLELYEGDAPGLRIRIEPVGRTGELMFSLRMNDEACPDVLLQTRVPVTYGTVQRLAQGLGQLIRDDAGTIEVELN